MSDETTSKSGKTWLYVVGFLVGLPMLYVLSVGPMAVLVQRKIIPNEPLVPIYAPLSWLAEMTGTTMEIVAFVECWMTLTATPHR
jgi:hypothetical protein